MTQDTTRDAGAADPEAPVRAAKVFLHAILLEDGIGAAADAASNPTLLPGLDPITRHLLVVELLEANLYERLKADDPFDEQVGDPYWAPLPYGGATNLAAIADTPAVETTRNTWVETRPGILRKSRYEQATVSAHRVMQTSGAIRTLAAARYATFDPPDGTPEMAPSDVIEHSTDHVSQWADSFLGPALGLGPYQTERLLNEAAWMRTRTPELLDHVAHQGPRHTDPGCGDDPASATSALKKTAAAKRRARWGTTDVPVNLDTVAAIAAELQDARPETCETVQDAVLRRGIQHTTRVQARRSTRALVTRHEAAAARQAAKKTAAQQHGVFFDPYPTPGLSMLSVIMDSERVAALYAAIEEHAQRLHRGKVGGAGDGRTLGQHRTDALFQLAMQDVSLTVNLDIVVPSADGAVQNVDGPTADGPTGSDRASSAGDRGHSGSGGRSQDVRNKASSFAAAGPPHQHSGPAAAASSEVTEPAANTAQPAEPQARSPIPPAFQAAPTQLHAALGDPAALAFHHTGAIALRGLSELLDALPRTLIRSRLRTLEEITTDSGASSRPDTYRPAESLRDKVRARDRTCRHPGCSRPARYTDLDHITPWPEGPTTLTNLHCLCRRHHRAKQAGWRIKVDRQGIEAWTSTTGRTFTSIPGVLDDLANSGFANAPPDTS